ncbi:ArsC family reductase [Shigella flexneri]
MVTLYGIKNCDTIKKARRWLEANNIDYRFHDYRVDGLDSELLNGFINELGWEALLNTRGTTWRKLDETTRNKITDAASPAALMTEMPAIIKNVHCSARLVSRCPLGFSDSSYQQFFHEV